MFEFFKNLFRKKTQKEINDTQIVNEYLKLQKESEKALKENFRDTLHTFTTEERLQYKKIYGDIFDDWYKNPPKFDWSTPSETYPNYSTSGSFFTIPFNSIPTTGSLWSGGYNITINPVNLGPILTNQPTTSKLRLCYDCSCIIDTTSVKYVEFSLPDSTGVRDMIFCNDCFEEKGGDVIKKLLPLPMGGFSVSPSGMLECFCCSTRPDSEANERYFMGIIEPLKSNNSKFYVFCKKCYTDYINVW